MKKISISIVIMLLALSINSKAQLNYLLSASSKPYVPVEGGISPHLVMSDPFSPVVPPWTLSDEGFAQVPLGFTFNYDGRDYTQATICANGFITLGDTITRRVRPLRLYINHLASGGFGFADAHVKPLLAPFWDDLDLVDTLNLVYKTTGHKPFRVFTVEWKKTKWTFESTQPGLSMEVKLYEKTNVIEFHYKDEGGTPFTPRAFASIGITSSYDYRGFISLENASSNPAISLLRANDSITVKPANNQVYTFTPSAVNIPELVVNSKFYTDHSARYQFRSKGPGHLEYAISKLAITPQTGTKSSSDNIRVSNLTPATTYYIYGRTVKNKNFYSQWTSDSFKTAVTPVALPYHISGNPNIYPYWPPDVRIQDMNDTGLVHYPNSDADWNVITDFPELGDTSLWSLSTFFYYYDRSANNWLFTPGLKLNGGKTYQLKFGYFSYPINEPGEIASFEVKYGEATGAVAMTSEILFKRDDIVTDLDLAPASFEDTTIEITPQHSGAYYLGFHNLTKQFNGHEGPVPVIMNISVSEKTTSTQAPCVLAARASNTDNVLNWTIRNNKKIKGFEIQKSTDGINFTKIGHVPSQKINNPLLSKTHIPFGIQRNTKISDAANIKSKDAKAFDELRPGFELQTTTDGINFKKLDALTFKGGKKTTPNNIYDYIDRNTTGINYYRLQQADQNGKLSYSNVVKLESIIPVITIYPNPVRDVLNVEIKNATTAKVNMVVTDAYGKIVINKSVELFNVKGINRMQLAVSKLPAGSYSLKLVCSNGCENAAIKFVKQ